MAHKLKRLSATILEKPQLIYAPKFKEIAEYLEKRNLSDDWFGDDGEMGSEECEQACEDSGIGKIKIHGPLTYRESGWEALCGGQSYQGILEEAKCICEDENKDIILMDVDSGGGEAYRCFETGTQLREMADQYGKRLIAYVDGMSASAAYALTSVCHEVIINPDAEAGSIGVVVRLCNNSEQMKNEGIEVTYITAGDEKVPFDADGKFKESFTADLQDKVDRLYGEFVSHVAGFRSIEAEVVRNTEARMFTAVDALSLGLVDNIMTGTEFKDHISMTVERLRTARAEQPTTDAEAGDDVPPIEIRPVRSGGNTLVDAKQDSDLINKKLDNNMPEEKSPEMVAQLKEFEATKAELAALKQEKAEAALAAKKDAINAELSATGITFSNLENIVAQASSSEDFHSVMTSMCNDFTASMKAASDKFDADLALMKENYDAKLEEAESTKEAALKTSESVKAEFAKPEGISGTNHTDADMKDETEKSDALANFITTHCLK